MSPHIGYLCVLLKVSGCVSYSFGVHMTTPLLPLFMCGLFSQDIQVVPHGGGVSFKRDCGDGHGVVQFTHAPGLLVQLRFLILATSYCCNGLEYVDDHALLSLLGERCWNIRGHGFTYYAQDIFVWSA